MRTASHSFAPQTSHLLAAPADLVRTAVSGNLLFDASKSKTELGMEYTPIHVAFEEAVKSIREADVHS